MSFIFFFFGTLLVAGAFSMAKIQREELRVARAKKAQETARIDAFRAKCYRPDGAIGVFAPDKGKAKK